jgi:ABC-type multidrug transport system ATPase subunit
MAAFLSVNKLGKKINNVNLLADLSFGIQKGELLFLLGKSGSGKSTLLKILIGFIKKDRGQIFVDGLDYDIRNEEIIKKIGYVSENDIFDTDLTVNENLLFSAELNNCNPIKIQEKINYWSNRLGFSRNLNLKINNINNSTLRKISFARTLIHNPEVILFDDFTSSMDLYDQSLIFEIIKEIKNDKSILFATNDLSLPELFSDRIIIIDNGSVTFNGTINNLESKINDSFKYRFTFKRIVPNEFLKALKNNDKIKNVTSRDCDVQILTSDKIEFFKIFKMAVNYELIDIKISDSKVSELFQRLTN